MSKNPDGLPQDLFHIAEYIDRLQGAKQVAEQCGVSVDTSLGLTSPEMALQIVRIFASGEGKPLINNPIGGEVYDTQPNLWVDGTIPTVLIVLNTGSIFYKEKSSVEGWTE